LKNKTKTLLGKKFTVEEQKIRISVFVLYGYNENERILNQMAIGFIFSGFVT